MSQEERPSSRLGDRGEGPSIQEPSLSETENPSGTPRIPGRLTTKHVYELLLQVSDNIASLRTQITDVVAEQASIRNTVNRIEQKLAEVSSEGTDHEGDSDGEETIGMFGVPRPGKKGKGKKDVKPPRNPSPNRPAPPVAKIHRPKFKIPDNYDGKNKGAEARQWMTRVAIYIGANGAGFADEREAIQWMLSLTEGAAARWAQPILEGVMTNKAGAPTDIKEVSDLFLTAFGDPDAIRAAERKITTLIQTTNTTEYTTEFQSLAADLTWNDDALKAQYNRGLHWKVKEQLSFLEKKPASLQSLYAKAIELDNLRRENEANRPPKPAKQNKPSSSAQGNKTTPTTTTTTRTTLKESGNYVDDAEKERRRKAGVCVKCGKAGHTFEECRTGWKATGKKEEKEVKVKKESGAVASIEEASDSDLSESEKE